MNPMNILIEKMKAVCDFNALPDFQTVKKYFGASVGYVKLTGKDRKNLVMPLMKQLVCHLSRLRSEDLQIKQRSECIQRMDEDVKGFSSNL